jgi:hypothetical protein
MLVPRNGTSRTIGSTSTVCACVVATGHDLAHCRRQADLWGVIRPAAGEVQFPDVGPDARIVMSLGTVLALRGGGDRPGHPECSEEHWDRSLDRQPPFEMVEAPGVALRAR